MECVLDVLICMAGKGTFHAPMMVAYIWHLVLHVAKHSPGPGWLAGHFFSLLWKLKVTAVAGYAKLRFV